MRLRWDTCITHRGTDAENFITEYFGAPRTIFLVGGAGFDPRTLRVPRALSEACKDQLNALYFREERGREEPANRERADEHASALSSLPGTSTITSIAIFSEDGAVTGGRRAVDAIAGIDLGPFNEIVVDLSALSKGIAFPIVRFLLERIDAGDLKANLHLLVIADAAVDRGIRETSSDKVEPIHGFGGGRTLSAAANRVQLWIPQLVSGQQSIADRIYAALDPAEVCPVLPFPSAIAYTPAELLNEYREQVESRWEVGARGFIYASESDPLDLYRTVLRLDSRRAEIFAQTRGSLTILTPLGSKMLSLGALMAALERDLPIVHVESLGYDVDWAEHGPSDTGDLAHIWLAGDPYWQEK